MYATNASSASKAPVVLVPGHSMISVHDASGLGRSCDCRFRKAARAHIDPKFERSPGGGGRSHAKYARRWISSAREKRATTWPPDSCSEAVGVIAAPSRR